MTSTVVEPDISHLDFPVDEVSCQWCDKEAQWRLIFFCDPIFLQCDHHAKTYRDAMSRADTCQCGGCNVTVSDWHKHWRFERL